MAEETKNAEVELDTDGVNEERVDIPEAKEPDESFAKKEDVDLGYTDIKSEDNVTGEKTAKELLQARSPHGGAPGEARLISRGLTVV